MTDRATEEEELHKHRALAPTKLAALAELGRYPLQIYFWQQILKYHQRTFGLDDTRLVSLAMMDGLKFSAGTAGVDKGAEWYEQFDEAQFVCFSLTSR